jgi:hypothetical protein
MRQTDKSVVELNKLIIPLAELRMQIVELMKDGFNEAPLGDFLLMIRHITYPVDESSTQPADRVDRNNMGR